MSSTSLSASSSNSLLSYPAKEDQKQEIINPISLQRNRLFIGNLHPTVTEYSLLQIFSKYGKITNLDFLFHNTGLMRGKPRGYAFLEYLNESDAAQALETAHNKLIRGRHITVTYANQAPLDTGMSKARKPLNDAGRPTTLSMIKTGVASKASQGRTVNKIAQMEAKLNQLRNTPSPPSVTSSASLPAKPPPPLPIIRIAGQKPELSSLPATITKPSAPKQHPSRTLTGVIIKKKLARPESQR